MAVKPLRPEMLYNSLSIALFQSQPKPGAKKNSFTPRVQSLALDDVKQGIENTRPAVAAKS